MLNFDDIRFNCRLYNGYKPCRYGMNCQQCQHFEPITGYKQKDLSCPIPVSSETTADNNAILIIKTGALGDVLRTTTLLPALANAFPNTPIDWVTAKNARSLLENNPYIRDLFTLDSQQDLEQIVAQQKWTSLYCFEKTDLPLKLAGIINARKRFGFGPNHAGKPVAFTPEGRYALMLGLDDDLKFHKNKKPYSRIITETAGLVWNRAPYVMAVNPAPKKTTQLTIGLNTGCGDVFKTKQWPQENWQSLANIIHKNHPQAAIWLLGGPSEESMNASIAEQAPFVVNTGNRHSLLEFADIIAQCDIIVSADTMAMHMGIALEKFVIAIFGSTSAEEIDLYDRGICVIAQADCRPCFKKQCPHTCDGSSKCMRDLNAETVYSAMASEINSEN